MVMNFFRAYIFLSKDLLKLKLIILFENIFILIGQK